MASCTRNPKYTRTDPLFIPEAKIVFSTFDSSQHCRWAADSSHCLVSSPSHIMAVYDSYFYVVFSAKNATITTFDGTADGKTLAVAFLDFSVSVCYNGEITRTMKTVSAPSGVAITSDASIVAAITQEGDVYFWDAAGQVLEHSYVPLDASGRREMGQIFLPKCIFSPNGKFLATSGGLFETDTQTVILDYKTTNAFSFSHDSTLFIFSKRDQIICLDLRDTLRPFYSILFDIPARLLSFHSSDRAFVVVQDEGKAKFYAFPFVLQGRQPTSSKIPQLLATYECTKNTNQNIYGTIIKDAAFQPRGDKLALCTNIGTYMAQFPWNPWPTFTEIKPFLIAYKKCIDSPFYHETLPIEVLQLIIEMAWDCDLPSPLHV